MGKHETGYRRVERDCYPTPTWTTEALLEVIDVKGKRLWEHACGDGDMSEPLKAAGANVFSTDIESKYADEIFDYLSDEDPPKSNFDGAITNPPFGIGGRTAVAFIEKGLSRICNGFLALLLPIDFDSAKTRTHLFGSCPQFVGKIVLTDRCKWFVNPLNPKVSPKENFAWYLWGNVKLRAHPSNHVIRYAPQAHQSPVRRGAKKKQPQRPHDWREQAHIQARAVLARVKARDKAAAKARAKVRAAQHGADHARD
jgi:predicted RNA methylase